jgi:hypothetical protein
MAQGTQDVRAIGRPNRLRIATAVVLAIVVAVVVWFIVKGKDDETNPTSVSPTASAATLSALRALPREVGHPVYWAGARPTYTQELTDVDGNLFIRYLPAGVDIGDPRPDFLTIGTYRVADAYTDLKRRGRRRGNHLRRATGGGIAVWSDSRPQSVYLAYPRTDIQVEIYDTSAERARRLATTGTVEPIR